ncbi:MAG: glycosyltransferase [Bacteroidetes bacterium]|nr:MAG: glycosyltransferase [Bacteroidota bacterium]
MSSRKKFFYLSPYDLQRPRTNQVSDMRFCEAFAQNDFEVEIICPTVQRKDNLEQEKIRDYYELDTVFDIHFLNTSYLHENLRKTAYLRLSWKGFQRVRKQQVSETMYVCSRSEIMLLFCLLYKKLFFKKNWKIIPWLHELKSGQMHRWVYRRSDYILATNSNILEDLNTHLKIHQPGGITLNPISRRQAQQIPDRKKAREIIGYHDEQFLVVYTGKLYRQQREIELLIQCAQQLPEINFLFTGGKPEVVEYYHDYFQKKQIQNIRLSGYLPDYRSIKYYQQAADLLVSYYTAEEHALRYNLPNKLAEYFLSGNPVVTPFYEATKDFLNSEIAFEVAAENPIRLAEEIRALKEDSKKRNLLAQKALEYAQREHYQVRVQEIIRQLKL